MLMRPPTLVCRADTARSQTSGDSGDERKVRDLHPSRARVSLAAGSGVSAASKNFTASFVCSQSRRRPFWSSAIPGSTPARPAPARMAEHGCPVAGSAGLHRRRSPGRRPAYWIASGWPPPALEDRRAARCHGDRDRHRGRARATPPTRPPRRSTAATTVQARPPDRCRRRARQRGKFAPTTSEPTTAIAEARRLAGAGASRTHPSNAPPEQEEVAAAADDAPDAWHDRRCPVSVHLHAPARPVVLDEAHVKRLGASAWAEHGSAERRVVFSYDVQDRVDHLAGLRPALDEDRSIPCSAPRHSVSSGMSRSGRMSPRPTSFAKRGDGPPSGSFMNRSRVML